MSSSPYDSTLLLDEEDEATDGKSGLQGYNHQLRRALEALTVRDFTTARKMIDQSIDLLEREGRFAALRGDLKVAGECLQLVKGLRWHRKMVDLSADMYGVSNPDLRKN